MKRLLQVLMAMVCGMLFFQGCSPNYYLPNTQNVPIITEKGQFNATIAGNGNQLELQGSCGISNSVALQLNGDLVFPQETDSGDGGSGKYIELGLGYFHNFSDHFQFEIYGLGGLGGMENHRPTTVSLAPGTTGEISATVWRIGVQPSLSYHNDYFSVSGSARISNLNYFGIDGSLVFDGEDQVTYLNDNSSNVLVEPAITLRGGLPWVKLQIQYLRSFNLNHPDFRQDGALMTLGLNFNFMP